MITEIEKAIDYLEQAAKVIYKKDPVHAISILDIKKEIFSEYEDEEEGDGFPEEEEADWVEIEEVMGQ